MVSDETGLPDGVSPGQWRPGGDRPEWGMKAHDASSAVNLKWAAPLGVPMGDGVCYGTPVVSQGRVLIGCDGSAYDRRFVQPTNYFTDCRFAAPDMYLKRAGLLCFDAQTGRLQWQYNVNGHVTYTQVPGSQCRVGICNSPAVEGHLAYFVGYQNEVMCVDLDAHTDGNDGHFREEADYLRTQWPVGRQPQTALERLEPSDTDIVWMYHIPRRLGVTFDCAPASSPLIYRDRVYVGTSVGVSHKGRNHHRKSATPEAPALIVLDKNTGQLLAVENDGIASRVLHGAWSSPSLAVVGGKPLILFGGGDRYCYAFDPEPGPGRERTYASPVADGGQVTIPRSVGVLRCVWRFDANGDNRFWYDWYVSTPHMPGAVMGSPVCLGNRVYVNVGVDWSRQARGLLSCYDASRVGEISKSGRIWISKAVGRSCSTPAVSGGLVFTADYDRKVHCIDAATGASLWEHRLKGAIHASPLVADGKVYIGSSAGDFVILRASREKAVLCEVSFSGEGCRNGIESSAVAANGVLYVATQTVLYAFAVGRDARSDQGRVCQRHAP
jgi:outer membrane protein assembly factor BamB